jgi:hypothetical protein
VALECFDSYKIDYSDEFLSVFISDPAPIRRFPLLAFSAFLAELLFRRTLKIVFETAIRNDIEGLVLLLRHLLRHFVRDQCAFPILILI